MNRYRWLRVLKVTLFIVIAIGVIGAVVMSLWNWLAPDVFGGRTIDFWQAIGLFALARLLVGGLRGGGHRAHWRHRMAERWDSLSEDERAKARAAMQRRCGGRERAETPAAGTP